MKWIDYATPTSVQEAVDLLAQHKGRAGLLAGGTDVLVLLRADRKDVDVLLDIADLDSLLQPERSI